MYFVGITLVTKNDEMNVKFLKKQPTRHLSHVFTFPKPDDLDEVDADDIVALSDLLMSAGGTARAKRTLAFHDFVLDNYKISY